MSHSPSLQVIAVPAFADNYLWLFHREGDKRAYVVDPGDANTIQEALRERGLELAGILITHHHPDHTGGIDGLLASWPVPVYGPAGGSVPQVTEPLAEGDQVALSDDLVFRVLAVPGHTLDHIAYFARPEFTEPLLFCGDTLFAGGCGRLFEGSAEQMYRSLEKFAQLPDNTRVYCAHEYTLANLAFASAVEADNGDLVQRVAAAKATRARGEPTVPSAIGLEKATNPFMRCHLDTVRAAAETHGQRALNTPEEVLAAVRRWKDGF